MGQLNRNHLAYLLELTLSQFLSWRGGVVFGAIRSRELYEVVANPGCDLVHGSLRIDKGECGEADNGKPRSQSA